MNVCCIDFTEINCFCEQDTLWAFWIMVVKFKLLVKLK